jgi:hypothetical protein
MDSSVVDGWRIDRWLHSDDVQRVDGRHCGGYVHDKCGRPNITCNDVRHARSRSWDVLRGRDRNERKRLRLPRVHATDKDIRLGEYQADAKTPSIVT